MPGCSRNWQVASSRRGNPRVANLFSDLGAYELSLPTAYNDSYATPVSTMLTLSAANGVLANDLANKGGKLSAVLVTKPASRTLSLMSDESFTYKSVTGFTGIQSFTYKAKNSKGYSSPATVTITVG